MRTRTRFVFGLMFAIMMVFTGSAFAQNGPNGKPNDKPNGEKKPDFPPFKKVSEGYKKVVSTADGKPSLYTIWTREKDGQVLAELPRGWKGQKYYFAVTQSGGAIFAGLQGPTRYAYWKRFDKRMALIEPQLATRSTGDPESKSSVERLFTGTPLGVLMGSVTDWPTMQKCAETLSKLGITHECNAISAHRNAERLAKYVKDAEQRGVKVFICAAGGAAHLAGWWRRLRPCQCWDAL